MAVYVEKNGAFYDKATGERMALPDRGELCAPMVIPDTPDYRSPIDGRVISGRSQRREDLKRNNCVEFEPSMSPTKGRFKNRRFCKKHGLPVAEEFR